MNDSYSDQFAALILNELKGGAKKWRQCWRDTLGNRPLNGATLRRYRGGNWVRLSFRMKQEGWQDPRFFTYKQLRSLGAHVKFDAKPTLVRYCNYSGIWGQLFNGYENKGGNFVVRYSEVYNAEQCYGLPAVPKTYEQEWAPYETAERVLDSSGIEILYDQQCEQYYNFEEDKVHLTPKGNFPTADDFYCTAFHELAHATGHESRLKRDMGGGFGSEKYAREELRAEIASMMMCAKLGIVSGELSEHQLGYLDHWGKLLEDSPSEITKACNAAERICQWLFSRVENEGELNLYDGLLIVRKVSRKKKGEIGTVIFSREFRPLADVAEEKERLAKKPESAEIQEQLLRMKLTPQEIRERIQLLKSGQAQLGVDHRC